MNSINTEFIVYFHDHKPPGSITLMLHLYIKIRTWMTLEFYKVYEPMQGMLEMELKKA